MTTTIRAVQSVTPADIERRWPIVALGAMTYLLSLPLFEPRAVWPLGYMVFVPWLIAIVLARRSAWVYLVSFAFCVAFWLTHWRWLYPVSPIVYGIICVILAMHFLLVVWPVRYLYRRRGVGMTIVFPIVWTASELFHSRGMFGGPWCLLSHSQIRFSVIIQIADLVGALGVTFVVAMVNGWLADMVLYRIARRRQTGSGPWPRPLVAYTMATILVVGGTALYGWFRLSDEHTAVGPRVAVVQGDFPIQFDPSASPSVSKETPSTDDEIDLLLRNNKQEKPANIRLAYLRMIREAAQSSPDLIVMPEEAWAMVLNREFRQMPLGDQAERLRMQLQHEEFARLADRYRVSLLVGAGTIELQAPGDYPAEVRRNSAYCYKSDGMEPARYDKIGLVLFGEYLPFRSSRRFFRVFRLLNDGFWNPWGRGGAEYVITPGTEFMTFSIPAKSQGNKTYSFAVAICYEDTLSQLYRQFVVDAEGRKRVDFMLTMSNARWFAHGHQQVQHLASCAFRAVENRVWIARASDGGISGFINPDGTWYDLVGCAEAKTQASVMGTRSAEAKIDSRVTIYSRYGDWFAWSCLALTLLAVLDALWTYIQRYALNQIASPP